MESVRLSGGMELSSFEGEPLNRQYLMDKTFNSETENQAKEEILNLI